MADPVVLDALNMRDLYTSRGRQRYYTEFFRSPAPLVSMRVHTGGPTPSSRQFAVHTGVLARIGALAATPDVQALIRNCTERTFADVMSDATPQVNLCLPDSMAAYGIPILTRILLVLAFRYEYRLPASLKQTDPTLNHIPRRAEFWGTKDTLLRMSQTRLVAEYLQITDIEQCIAAAFQLYFRTHSATPEFRALWSNPVAGSASYPASDAALPESWEISPQSDLKW